MWYWFNFASAMIASLEEDLGTRYAIRCMLSGGAMAHVFMAWEWALSRPVVIKVLLPQLAADVSLERFKREIMLAASLRRVSRAISASRTS